MYTCFLLRIYTSRTARRDDFKPERVIVRSRRHARRPHRNIIIHNAIRVRRRRQTTSTRDPRIQPALTRRVRHPGTIAVSKAADKFLR